MILIFWLTPYNTNYWQLWVVIIYTVICLTDLVDGWVARHFNMVTEVGKILDPLADKIVVLALLPLLEMQVISSFPVFIILAREFAIMGVRIVSAKNGTIIPANLSGKIKTAFTLPVCGILFGRVATTEISSLPLFLMPFNLLRRWVFSWPNWVIDLLIWTTVIVTIWSFMDYFGSFLWQEYTKKTGRKKAESKKLLLSMIPNSISALNLTGGLIGIYFAFLGRYHITVILVLSSLVLDAIDGNLARKLGAETKIGAKLDSSADFISFGLAPAVVSFHIILGQSSQLYHFLVAIGTAVFYGFSVYYRLRRFDKTGHSPFFEGLPSPVGASFVVVAAISTYLYNQFIFIPLVIFVSIMMISSIPYAHMDVATNKTFLKHVKLPAVLFYILTILSLSNVKIPHYLFAYEILFTITSLYIVSPVFIKNISIKDFSE
ncbi:MAG: hypothetical protein GY730_09095 [bacterium]|nr:hypothetical protein [bacterium]